MMRVLVACEFSGIVRDAFIAKGHRAASCDLRPSESLPKGAQRLRMIDIEGQHVLHYMMDVQEILRKQYRDFDLMIAHPPCTYLTNAGVRWLYKDGQRWPNGKDAAPNPFDAVRWRAMLAAVRFFNAMLATDIPRVCVENPIPHPFANACLSSEHAQIIQPHQFGHAETKATCLWLKNLPALAPTKIIQPDYDKYPPGRGNGFEPRVHYESPGKKGSDDREKNRSRTLKGVAQAMAEQWGNL